MDNMLLNGAACPLVITNNALVRRRRFVDAIYAPFAFMVVRFRGLLSFDIICWLVRWLLLSPPDL